MSDTFAGSQNSAVRRRPLPDAKTLRRAKLYRKYNPLWFVLPGLLFFAAFMIYPAVSGFAISLTAWTGVGNDFHFVGLDNFVQALSTWPLYRAAWHNLIMFVVILIFQHTVGLFIAVQLNARPRFMEVYRTILFLPVIISLVSTGFIWTLMLSPNIGVINPLLHDIGLGFLAHNWLSDPQLALGTVIAVQCWNVLGWAIIIYLAGLQSIPEELVQAAEMDGAGGWQRFWNITLPMISPVLFFNVLLESIHAFQVFGSAYVVSNTQCGPADATLVYTCYLYQKGFKEAQMGFASAMAWTLVVAVALVTAVLFWSQKKWVHYEEAAK